MVPAVTADLERTAITCRTPLEITSGEGIAQAIILVPILRAGLGFLDGFLDLIPHAAVAHIGLARNEVTLEPEAYYLKHPRPLEDADLILLDPMLATGGSAVHAVRKLLDEGATRIRFVCLLAAPEGISAFQCAHPKVPIFTAPSTAA